MEAQFLGITPDPKGSPVTKRIQDMVDDVCVHANNIDPQKRRLSVAPVGLDQ